MGRLTRECVITEKIDGTNAQVLIVPVLAGDLVHSQQIAVKDYPETGERYAMFAGSRTRFVTPGKGDNMGFAGWVQQHADELFALGPGRHFGEWWGPKIQRGYGITGKMFSLFNTSRWTTRYRMLQQGQDDLQEGQQFAPACCDVVPVLYRGLFSERAVDNMLLKLTHEGSVAAPGFMQPEGIVIFHTATGTMFKKTLDNDEKPKGQA